DAEGPPFRDSVPQGVPILRLVEGIADLEYAIGSREMVKRMFMPWIVAHVTTAILMYLLLALHVAGEIYYGLRWIS
ncbi:MAG: iron reductase, partial [Bradyrhizobium sp.]|nr:iron reductase [Bradyrhizobium sp.]